MKTPADDFLRAASRDLIYLQGVSMLDDQFDDDLDAEFGDEFEFEVLDDSAKIAQWMTIIEQIEFLGYVATLKQGYEILQALQSQQMQINYVIYWTLNDEPEDLKELVIEAIEEKGHSALVVCDLSPNQGFTLGWVLQGLELDCRLFEMTYISPDGRNWDGMGLTLVRTRKSLLPEVVAIDVLDENGQISFLIWEATQSPIFRKAVKNGRLCQGHHLRSSRLRFVNSLSLESELFLYEAAGDLLAKM